MCHGNCNETSSFSIQCNLSACILTWDHCWKIPSLQLLMKWHPSSSNLASSFLLGIKYLAISPKGGQISTWCRSWTTCPIWLLKIVIKTNKLGKIRIQHSCRINRGETCVNRRTDRGIGREGPNLVLRSGSGLKELKFFHLFRSQLSRWISSQLR